MAMDWSLAHVNDRTGLIIMCVIFSISSTAVVVLRFWSRRFKKLRWQADDWTMVVALIFVVALNGMMLAGCAQHVLTGHSPVQNKLPVPTEREHAAQRYKYGLQTTEKPAFGLIKVSVLLLWRRIFGAVRAFNRMCWVMIGIIIAWSTAFFFATLFQCGVVWELNWAPIWTFLTKCTDTLTVLTVFTTTDILTDLIIIAMPVPMIWKLQMSVRRKFAVSSIFLVGFFTTGAGGGRMFMYMITSYHKLDNPDFIQDITNFELWSIIELNVGMLCANMPTLLPIGAKVTSSLRSFRDSHKHLSLSWPGHSHSHKLSDQDSHSDSSVKNLAYNADKTGICRHGNQVYDAGNAMDFGPRMETKITTDPTYDLEMQPQAGHTILVHKKMSHHRKDVAM